MKTGPGVPKEHADDNHCARPTRRITQLPQA
jgi:hypothetical protein